MQMSISKPLSSPMNRNLVGLRMRYGEREYKIRGWVVDW